ncbi:MAG: DUF4826 family protein [Gammaproteobacteria bacterium]
MSASQPFDQAEFAEWHKAQQQQVADYLRKLQVFTTDITGEWLWIVPQRAMLGRVWPKHGERPKLWVITGIVPTDHVDSGGAKTCREAGRYFALKWQMEAARLEKGTGADPAAAQPQHSVDWKNVGGNISGRAEWLYGLVDDDRHWTAEGLPLFRIDYEAAESSAADITATWA